MRSPIIFGVGGAVMLVLVVSAWQFYSARSPEQVEDTPKLASVPRDSGTSVLLRTRDGKNVTVPDFTYTHPSVTYEETGRIYVFLTQTDDLVEKDPRYGITYGSDSTFIIALLASPLSESRAAAEVAFKEFVPLPDSVLCALSVTVQVADTIDTQYAGKNVGLSFCPGALPLP